MIKRKQIYFHNPENGAHGDCYRTCIACILEIPNFGVHYDDNEKFFAEADKYLASQFLARVIHAFDCTLEDLLKMQNHCNPDAYWILTGRSKNETTIVSSAWAVRLFGIPLWTTAGSLVRHTVKMVQNSFWWNTSFHPLLREREFNNGYQHPCKGRRWRT